MQYLKNLKPIKNVEKKFLKYSKENNFNKMKIIYNLKKAKSTKLDLNIDISRNNIYRKKRKNKNAKSLCIKNIRSIFKSIKKKNNSSLKEKDFMKNFCYKILNSCKDSVEKKEVKNLKSYRRNFNKVTRLKEIKLKKKFKSKNKEIFNFVNLN